jgi:hypothetical protein
MEEGRLLAASCSDRGGGGVLELIHVGGTLASTILCRHGGEISTSGMEVLHRFRRGCSKPLCYKVIRSPWLGGGPRLRIIAGRGLMSNKSLFLGGVEDAGEKWRRFLGTTWHVLFCSRVLCVKKERPYLQIVGFLGRDLLGHFYNLYLSLFYNRKIGVSLYPTPLFKKKLTHLFS